MFGAVRKLTILNYFHIFKYKIKQSYSKGGMLFIYRKWMHAQREQSFSSTPLSLLLELVTTNQQEKHRYLTCMWEPSGQKGEEEEGVTELCTQP